jgi:hypothetical protein
VHFLTGSEAGPESIFRTPALAEYGFGMDFDLKAGRTVVERSGGAKAKIFVTTPPAAKARFSATEWCVERASRRANVRIEQPRSCRQLGQSDSETRTSLVGEIGSAQARA